MMNKRCGGHLDQIVLFEFFDMMLDKAIEVLADLLQLRGIDWLLHVFSFEVKGFLM